MTSVFTWRGGLLLFAACVSALVASSSGQFGDVLVHTEKQRLLDLHNYQRASVEATNMRRMSWSEGLESDAQTEANECFLEAMKATNTYFNVSEIKTSTNEVLSGIVSEWLSSSQQPVQWHRTSMLGCAISFCGRLFRATELPVTNAYFVVCKYSPSYFKSADNNLYNAGPCRNSSCQPEASMCVPYNGGVNSNSQLHLYCASDRTNPSAPTDVNQPTTTRTIYHVTPRIGSVTGGTKIEVIGRGFSINQFDGGNTVVMVPRTGSGNITCDVVSYSTSPGRIQCVTRSAPSGTTDAYYDIHVSVNDGKGYVNLGTCRWCYFRFYYWYWTPRITNMTSYASHDNSPVTIGGLLYSAGFDDPNDPEDTSSANTDRDDNRIDSYSRILIGGRGCDHMRENGSWYSATISDNGQWATVECRPQLAGVIDSHNVTVVLTRRGNSIIHSTYNIRSLDNKLRPHDFQTHADIIGVSPRVGSINGGTKITITMNHTLLDYTEDIVVKVGGAPCDNMTVSPSANSSGYGTIECVTRPQPPQSTYYPGGRGILSDIAIEGTTSLNQAERQPRSSDTTVFDRFYLHSSFAGEKFTFVHRVSGFFVPPQTSLYTLNILSDDSSRTYLSNNMSSEGLRRIISNPYSRERWDRSLSQFSEPIALEKDIPYYFEVYTNQGGGPWSVGMAAKLHNSSLHGGEYDTDTERQRIEVTSERIEEEHMVKVEAEPHVQQITFQGSSSVALGSFTDVNCTVTVQVSTSASTYTFTISAFATANQWQQELNKISLITQVGHVMVKKTGHVLSPFNFWSPPDSIIIFEIVFVTNHDIQENHLPVISLASTIMCTSNSSVQLQLNVTNKVSQTLSVPASFSVGFNQTASRIPRFTPQVPTNSTPEQFEQDLNRLLSYGCIEDDRISAKSDMYETYETSSTTRDHPYAFCGFRSENNPRTVRDDRDYFLLQIPFICFAYRGSFPGLVIDYSYQKTVRNDDGPDSVSTESGRSTLNSNNCNNWPFNGDTSDDGWTEYGCVDVRTCINQQLPSTETIEYSRHFITRVAFNQRSTFYIDNLAFARSPIQISRIPTQAVIIPNNVNLRNIVVDSSGGLLQTPNISEITDGMGMKYTMTIAAFTIRYIALDCAFGMGLIQSHENSAGKVKISRVNLASMPVDGLFDITFRDRTLKDVNATTSRANMETLLNIEFKDYGEFSVSRSGSCLGYRWNIDWENTYGDQPQLQVTNERLTGAPAEVSATTLRDGGLWIRPIRGDMLRLPETEPQVEVIINQVPSSCNSKNCSFSYDDDNTPEITEISPNEGQGGAVVEIYGTDFSDDVESIKVVIGSAPCQVIFANESLIRCILGAQSAGCYKVVVCIDGMGVASSSDLVSFTYLVTVNSVSPSTGGPIGGNLVTITGEGFPRFVRERNTIHHNPLPWFRYGVGVPALDMIDAKYCPSFVNTLKAMFLQVPERNETAEPNDMTMTAPEMDTTVSSLNALIEEFTSQSPLQVTIGETPCLIVEATVTTITCVPLSSSEGTFDVAISVFNETYILNNAYTVSSSASITVQSISPLTGPVVGNSSITIVGSSFGSGSESDNIEVMIERRPCYIQFYNNTHIMCDTPRMEPGVYPIFISSTNGFAVKSSVVAGFNTQNVSVSSLFPTFTYRLEINNVSLARGSVLGGTEVTMYGGIFVNETTSVTVGDAAATITSVTDSELKFLTPSSSMTHTANISAQLKTDSNIVTYQLFWSRNEFTISVGDSIQWNWDTDLNVDQMLHVEIFETVSSTSSNRKLAGFASMSTLKSFTYTFKEVGTYFFASSNNLNIDLSFGEITVTEIATTQRRVVVYVGGIAAQYTMVGSPPMTGSRMRRQADCADAPTPPTNSDGLEFVYSPCLTPVVHSVNPNIADRLTTVFTISGIGFSELSNIVHIGDYPCIPQTQSSTTITCKFSSDASVQPPAFTSLIVSVRNTDPGYGDAFVQNETASTVKLRPVVTSVTPSQGSLGGGTDVTILGASLNFAPLDVRLGDGRCTAMTIEYNKIECMTTSSNEGSNTIAFYQDEQEILYFCYDPGNCVYSYLLEVTPSVDDIYPNVINSPGNQLIQLSGERFSSVFDQYSITLGSVSCIIMSANSSDILCQVPPLPSGSYVVRLSVCNLTNDGSKCFGNGIFEEAESTVLVEAAVTGVSPSRGSVFGETSIILSGYGFSGEVNSIVVTLDGSPCDVLSATQEQIACITSPHSAGMAAISVTDQQSSVSTGGLMFEYTADSTPVVTSISPSAGTSGQEVCITGDMFAANIMVTVGGAACAIQQVINDTYLTCTLGPNFAGSHPVMVMVPGIGSSGGDTVFTYTLIVDSISSTEGSFAGGNTLDIVGSGFDPSDTVITICGSVCSQTSTVPTVTTIACIVPSAMSSSDLPCNVSIESMGHSVVHTSPYIYRQSLTAVVDSLNDTRGGTEGGTALRIGGSGFTANVTVTIVNSPCIVVSKTDTEIICVTNRSGRTVRAPVMVWVDGKGFAQTSVEFWYVDLWSSRFTWGGGPLPREGDFVVIPKGQTLVLDTKTPVLAYLLIQGGELIFDREKGDNEVELHTNGGLITSGGRLEVGTEQNPFLSKTQIVLYGHVLSTEIPVYGAKTLALRKGEIDMHGRPLNVTWTRLSMTAQAGDEDIHVQDYVDWDVGGKIVLASTSFSQRENEEKEIKSIEQGPYGSIITLTSPLDYEHISVEQTIAGKLIETRGEVGYLTRNIVVRGNRNEEWDMQVPDCPEEFRPGQFEVQTCFQGRFGSEVVGDQFGSQIMIHAAEQNKGHVRARFEYIEVTHAGQAFRLGRYPIHFHLNGNVSGSYVRGCGIHHTFNRAVTIHTVDYLLVENNVAFNILGHAYFLEDGIEQYNIIQDNLGVFVRASSSLLNVDITPATFWVVNPNNILRRNAAAGGTHFGFWYRPPDHPTGPSFTTSLCPKKQPVLQFENNTAHSFGWYGLWIFRSYYPTITGECSDTTPGPAHFDRFFAWRNDRGVEFSDVGSVQLRDSIMMDNTLAGVEYTAVDSVWDEVNGPLVRDTLIIGRSDISDDDFCTSSGLVTPKSYYLFVSGVTFANFDRASCVPITACSHCKFMQGGFETRYKNITYINAGDTITRWKWPHEQIHRDLDGTLTNSGSPKILIPSNDLLDPNKCQNHPASAKPEGTQGSICDGNVQFGRLAVFDPSPSSLEFVSLNVTNKNGKIILPYVFKRLRGTGPAQMMHVELNTSYELAFQEGEALTNISYTTLISGFSENDHITLQHVYPQTIDRININGITDAVNASVLGDPAIARTGDFYIGSDNVTLNYIIKGGDFVEKSNTFKTEKCAYPMCIPPPPATIAPPTTGRPATAVMWSNTSIWPGNALPQSGDSVTIPSVLYVLVDVAIPKLNVLLIEGGLEVLDGQDHTIEANTIVIDGGQFVAGYPETPFKSKLRIILHGHELSPVYRHGTFQTIVGSKAIGVFGQLILHSDMENPTSWTMLENTANAGSNEITLSNPVDWEVGDEIVITSTSFDAYETEKFQISSISNSRVVLTLNQSLSHTHLGVQETIGSVSYSIRAEVGRLTRKIVIENGDPGRADSEAFGCRVLVSSEGTTGTVQLEGVEFKGCGQLGYTDSFDPRFALAFVNTGRQRNAYVRHCSFHDGYNTALGIFGTDNMEVISNVIHGTVGPSMIITGSSHNIVNNLASLSHFIGTYRNRNEPFNDLWTANFEIAGTIGINFTHNHAAGGAKAGIHMDGEDCVGSSSTVRHNLAHSSLHCFHVGYEDGSSTPCSKYVNITAYACYHYGIFSYTRAGIQLHDSTFINNKAAIYTTVFAPAALTHKVGTNTIEIERTKIISASTTFDCSQDDIVPEISKHPRSHRGIISPTGGHVGIIHPTFFSQRGAYPKFAWPVIHGYPAIAGHSTINQVSFTNFGLRCSSRKDAAIMTSPLSEDANHPVQLESISFESDGRFTTGGDKINNDCKVYVHEPALNRVNPSDCVDMDCDGMKHVILTDIDGSFTETNSFRTIVSRAEFQWGGDRRRGLGDYRIPLTMLSRSDGSRIPVDQIYPQKGVVRSNTFGGTDDCSFNAKWNMYLCENLEHLLLVLESLDQDTEVRRLSPIGIGANGFINLLNGPMDHGWCGGYTCQERISTFYGIVASSFNYTVGLTSTNPQNFAIHLLNAKDTQAIIVRIIYNNPQRLDVYINNNGGEDVYVPPKNAKLLDDGNLEYASVSNVPDEQYFPTIDDEHGANFYDRALKQLHVNIKGKQAYKIITTPVIVLSVTLQVTTENFFAEEFLVRNLALLLNIPSDRIRVVNVVRETPQKRRRRKRQTATEMIEIEIGDPPTQVIATTDSSNDTATENTTAYATAMPTVAATAMPNATSRFSFTELTELTEMVAAVVQTGELFKNSTGVMLVEAEVDEPEPAPVDPTGGARVTEGNGGPQPEDVGENSTLLTFSEKQQINESAEQNATSSAVRLSIPSSLKLSKTLTGTVVEGLPLGSNAPEFTMYDTNGMVSESLGIGTPWKLTATMTRGPQNGFLSNHVVDFVQGRAQFQGIVFSHPGTYHLVVDVTFPETAQFSFTLGEVTVLKRPLFITVVQQPQDGNTTFPLYPYPIVRLTDDNGGHIQQHTWRNSTWYISAILQNGDQKWTVKLIQGEATFTDIKILTSERHQLSFKATTDPQPSSHDLLPADITSTSFRIRQPKFTRFVVTYPVNYTATVKGREAQFIKTFETTLISQYPEAELFDTTVAPGSIVVSTFVTARTTRLLVDIINKLKVEGNETLRLIFRNQILMPSSVVQDPEYPVSLDNHLVLILATTIPGGVAILTLCCLICLIACCRRKRTKELKPMVSISNLLDIPLTSSGTENTEDVAEFYLKDQNHAENEYSVVTPKPPKKLQVISSMVEVPGSFFANPSAKDDYKEDLGSKEYLCSSTEKSKFDF